MSSRLRSFLATRRLKQDRSPSPAVATEANQHDDLPYGYGINILADPGSASVDIVFVHGLTGSVRNTWFHRPSQTYWPTDLLSYDMPHARILGFSYDADIVNFSASRGDASTARMTDHAATLLSHLYQLRQETGSTDRPLVVIAHSLGGLVTQHMLHLSTISPDMRSIETCVLGIIFLGTPNLGSDLASWGKVAADIVRLSLKPANKDILAVLHPNSEVTSIVQRDFYSLLRRRNKASAELHVTCFFEELPVKGVGLVVPRHSAEIKGYGCHAIHANHKDMTKFTTRDDSAYRSIVGEITRWYDAAKRPPSIFPEYNVPRLNAQQHVERTELMEDVERTLKKFHSQNSSHVALLHGLAGSGKTQVARAFAEKWTKDGRHAYLLDLTSPETLAQGLKAFVRDSRVYPEQELTDLTVIDYIRRAHQVLSATTAPWLLVLDNYDSFDTNEVPLIEGLIPETSLGHVLVTTKNSGLRELFAADCVLHHVGQMSHSEALALFRACLRITDDKFDDKARRLASDICSRLAVGLPLAIGQAAAFIRQGSRRALSLSSRLERYIEQCEINLGHQSAFVGDYKRPLTATFGLSLNTIRNRNATAANLLLLCGYFHHTAIRKAWFRRLAVNNEPARRKMLDLQLPCYQWIRPIMPTEPTDVWNDLAFDAAVALLEDYDIIKVYDEGESWDTHPLVHASCPAYFHECFGEDHEKQAVLAAVVLGVNYHPLDDRDQSLLEIRRRELTPHIEAWLAVAATQTHLLQVTDHLSMPVAAFNTLYLLYDPWKTDTLDKSYEAKERLSILALNSSALSSKVYSLMLKIVIMWMSDNFDLPTDLTDKLNHIVEQLAEQAAKHEPSSTNICAYAVQFLSRRRERVSAEDVSLLTEVALDYVEKHSRELLPCNLTNLRTILLLHKAAHHPRPEERMRAVSQLDEEVDRATYVFGPKHVLTLQAVCRAMVGRFNQSGKSDKTAVQNLRTQLAGLVPGDHIQQIQLIQQQIQLESRDSGPHSEAVLRLCEEHREQSAAYYGRWSMDTLGRDSTYYYHLDYRTCQSSRTRCPRFFRRDSKFFQPTDDVLTLPVTVAICMKIYGPAEDVQKLWKGTELQVSKMYKRYLVLADCKKALEEARKASMRNEQTQHAEVFEKTCIVLQKEIEPQAKQRATNLRETFPRLLVLWNFLDVFDDQLAKDGGVSDESRELENRMISHISQTTHWGQAHLLYLLVHFLMYIVYSERQFAILSSNALKVFDELFLACLGEKAAMTHRWMMVKAIASRHAGDEEKSRAAEEFLQKHSARQHDENAAIAKANEARGEPRGSWADNVDNHAVLSLERLAVEYERRGWKLGTATTESASID